MKMSSVSHTLWVAQVLTSCALLLTPNCLAYATVEPHMAVVTPEHTAAPAVDHRTPPATAATHVGTFLRGSVGNNALGTSPHYGESLTQMAVSSNPPHLTTQPRHIPKTGTWSATFAMGQQTDGLTGQHTVQTRHESGLHHWETTAGTELSTAKIQLTVQPLSQVTGSWTEQQDQTGAMISTFTIGYKPESFSTQNRGVLKDTAGIKRWDSVAVTEHPTSQETDSVIRTTSWRAQKEETTVGRESKPETMETSPTMVALVNLTDDSAVTQIIKGSYNLTMGKQDLTYTTLSHDTTPLTLDKQDTRQTGPADSTSPDGSSIVPTAYDLKGEVTASYSSMTQTAVNTTQHDVPYSLSTKNLEETLSSNTSENASSISEVHADQDVEEISTESLTTTLALLTTATEATSRTDATYTDGLSGTLTNTTEAPESTATAVNTTPPSESERGLWPSCLTEVSPPGSQRSSKLVCLVTLWSLAVTASVFLGLTIFLCARLSVVKQKRMMWRDRAGLGHSKVKETQSLWAEPGVSAEDRVEFWYTNGATLHSDWRGGGQGREERVRREREGARKEQGNEADLWLLPRVTMEDITEFWYGNRRVRNTDRLDRQCHLIGIHQHSQE